MRVLFRCGTCGRWGIVFVWPAWICGPCVWMNERMRYKSACKVHDGIREDGLHRWQDDGGHSPLD